MIWCGGDDHDDDDDHHHHHRHHHHHHHHNGDDYDQGWKKYFPFCDHRSDIKKFLKTEIACTKKNNNQF